MTVEKCALKLIEIIEVLCSSSCPDTGEAFDAILAELQPLIFAESERAATLVRKSDLEGAKNHVANEILRTSPGRLDVKYDRAYASPGKGDVTTVLGR